MAENYTIHDVIKLKEEIASLRFQLENAESRVLSYKFQSPEKLKRILIDYDVTELIDLSLYH